MFIPIEVIVDGMVKVVIGQLLYALAAMNVTPTGKGDPQVCDITGNNWVKDTNVIMINCDLDSALIERLRYWRMNGEYIEGVII